MAEAAAPVSSDIPDDIANVVRVMNQRNAAAGADEHGNPKDPEAASIVQAYQANTTPHYDGNILVPAKFKPIDLNPPSAGESFSRGIQNPMGVAPIARGAIESGLGAADSLITGSNSFGDEGRLGGLSNSIANYRRVRDQESALNDRAKDAHKGAYLGGQLTAGLPFAAAGNLPAIAGAGVAGSAIPAVQAGVNAATTAGLMGATQGFADSKGDLTKGDFQDFKKVAKDTVDNGMLAGAIGAILQGVTQGAGANSAPTEALEEQAGKKAFEALRPTGAYATKLMKDGRDVEVGRTLLDEGLIGPVTTRTGILKNVEKKLADSGEEIGYFAKEADKAISRDSALRGVSVPDLSKQIENQVIEPLSNDPSTSNIAQDVAKWVSNLKTKFGDGDISFETAQGFKKSLGAMKAKFQSSNDSLSKDAFQQVYGILNDHIENGISQVFNKAAPEINNTFLPAKSLYHDLMDAQQILETSTAQEGKNRALGMSELVLGGTAAAGEMAHNGGAVLPIVAGATVAGASKLAKTFGNQVQASFYDNIAKLMGLVQADKIIQKAGPEIIPDIARNLAPGVAASIINQSKREGGK